MKTATSFNLNAIPPQIGYYLAGFTDGEGSLNVSFRKRSDYNGNWKVSAAFNISNKDKVILCLCKKYFQCGTLRGRPDGVWYFEVNNLNAIINHVVPFFKRFPFLSAKKKNDFSKFCEILDILTGDDPRSEKNIRKILALRNLTNGGGKRKFSDEEILARFDN